MVSIRTALFVAIFFAVAASARAQGYFAYYQQPVYGYGYSHSEDSEDYDQPSPSIVSGGSQPTVRGSRAIIRHGVAYAPADAPDSVKHAIWAANTLRRKPYKWGGGHESFFDSGYDCSGTVSFALHYGGLLGAPMMSSDFLRFGERGRGRWITVYCRSGHTFAVIAGLRLDTTGNYGTEGPRWHADGRQAWGFEARHPEGL